MASIVLGIVGGAIGTVIAPGAGTFSGYAIGAAIGAAVGGVIDTFVIMPALFPRDTMQGPRLNDLQVVTASEGSPIKWVIGPRNRVAGTVIWMSKIIEVKTSSSVGKGGGSQKVDNYTYFVDIAIGICDAKEFTISRVKEIIADAKTIYDGQPTEKYESITFYMGDQTDPDPLIESYRGSANTPLYKNLCYVVIKRLALADFGNRVPNLTAIVEQAPDVSVGDAVTLIMEHNGFDDTEFNVSALPDCFKGTQTSGPTSGADTINPLALAYSFSVQEGEDGVIRFFPKGAEDTFNVDADDLAAHDLDGSDETPRKFLIDDTNDYSLPREVNVRFASTAINLQQGSEPARRIEHDGDDSMVVDLPISLTPVEASAIAKKILWATEGERQKIKLVLPPSYIGVQESDVLLFVHEGVDYRVFCTEVNRGFNYLVEVSGHLQQPQVYSQVGVATNVPAGSGDPYRPPELVSYVADLPALVDEQVTTGLIGLFWSTATLETDAQWRGAALFQSPDVDNYTEKARTATEGSVGETLIGPQEGPSLYWDEVNTLDIQLFQGSVASVSEAECLSGSNRIAVETTTGDWEIIGFQNVQVIGTRQYRLSRLIRGLRGTESLVGKHMPIGAKCIVLEGPGIEFYSMGLMGLGTNKYYKVVPVEGMESSVTGGQVVCNGRALKPFAPCHFTGEVDGSGHLVLNWTRRGKRFVPAFSPADSPLSPDETPETYRIRVIYGGEFGVVKRTVTVTATTTWTYTVAMQSLDGFSSGAPVRVEVNQVSNVVGHGYAAVGVFTL